MKVLILSDLVTKEGSLAVEVRQAEQLYDTYISRVTLYSCSYNCKSGRQVAFKFASEFCKKQNHNIVMVDSVNKNRRAVLQ